MILRQPFPSGGFLFRRNGSLPIRTVISLARLPGLPPQKPACTIISDSKQPVLVLKTKRSHWKIENQFHWVLDIVFREDENLDRKDHAVENLAVLCHMALNLFKNEKNR